jgi:hypothetical protein
LSETLKNIFVANVFIFFLFNTQTMHIKSFFTQQHYLLCFPKNLIPLRDSNPDLLVPEADATMSTAPRRYARACQKHFAISCSFSNSTSFLAEDLIKESTFKLSLMSTG